MELLAAEEYDGAAEDVEERVSEDVAEGSSTAMFTCKVTICPWNTIGELRESAKREIDASDKAVIISLMVKLAALL